MHCVPGVRQYDKGRLGEKMPHSRVAVGARRVALPLNGPDFLLCDEGHLLRVDTLGVHSLLSSWVKGSSEVIFSPFLGISHTKPPSTFWQHPNRNSGENP